jgi:hypothetical protein
MGNAKRKMNIRKPVVSKRKRKFWKDSEEKRLRDETAGCFGAG